MIDRVRDLDPLPDSRPLPASAWTRDALLDVVDQGGRPHPAAAPPAMTRAPLGIAAAVVLTLIAVVVAILLIPRPEATVEPAAVTRSPTTDELARLSAVEQAWNSGSTASFEDTFLPAWLVGEGMVLDDRIAYHERFIAAGGVYEFGDCSVIVATGRLRCEATLTDRLLDALETERRGPLFFLFEGTGKIVSVRPTPWAIYPEQDLEWLHFADWLDDSYPDASDPVEHLDEYLATLEP